jgi:hypothetical protein
MIALVVGDELPPSPEPTNLLELKVALTGLFWSGEIFPGARSGLVTEAQAIIGMPLTPLSYAGVARRTVRRCAVGVYYC